MLNCRSQVAGLQLEKKRSNLEPLQSLHVCTAYVDPESTIQAGRSNGQRPPSAATLKPSKTLRLYIEP